MHDTLHFNREKTPSGLTVFTQHRPLPWVAIEVIVMGGARHDPSHKPGTAHLLEHLISMGNEGYPRKEPTELYRWAVEQGFAMNWGATMTEATTYGGRAALRDMERLVQYLHALTMRPLLMSDLEHEIEIIRDERTEGGTRRIRDAQRARGKTLFGAHPLSRAETWPEDAILYGMTYEDVRKFHAAHYNCQNMAVVAVGDMDDDMLLYALDRYFVDAESGIEHCAHRQPPPALNRIPSPKEYRCAKEGGTVESVELGYSWVVPRTKHPTDERFLVSTLRSLLNDRVREKACAAYSVDVDVSRNGDCSVISINVMSPMDRVHVARTAIESAIEDDDALAEETRNERAEILLQTELIDETVGDVIDHAVSRTISDGAPEPLNAILNQYRSLTAEDIVDLRQGNLALDRAYVEIIEH